MPAIRHGNLGHTVADTSADINQSAPRRELHRVREEIEQDLVDLPLVGGDFRHGDGGSYVSNPYSFAAFPLIILDLTSSGTLLKSRAITSRECGQVASVCG